MNFQPFVTILQYFQNDAEIETITDSGFPTLFLLCITACKCSNTLHAVACYGNSFERKEHSSKVVKLKFKENASGHLDISQPSRPSLNAVVFKVGGSLTQ